MGKESEDHMGTGKTEDYIGKGPKIGTSATANMRGGELLEGDAMVRAERPDPFDVEDSQPFTFH